MLSRGNVWAWLAICLCFCLTCCAWIEDVRVKRACELSETVKC